LTWYTFFKSIHVVTAAIWVGGAAMIQAYAFRILRTGDGRRQADFAKDTEVVGMRVFIPASLILFLAAIAMMVNLHWSWNQNWIVLGLIAFGFSFVLGAGFLGPEGGRIAELIEQQGPDSPDGERQASGGLREGHRGRRQAGGMLVVMVFGIAAVLAFYRRSAQQVLAPATK